MLFREDLLENVILLHVIHILSNKSYTQFSFCTFVHCHFIFERTHLYPCKFSFAMCACFMQLKHNFVQYSSQIWSCSEILAIKSEIIHLLYHSLIHFCTLISNHFFNKLIKIKVGLFMPGSKAFNTFSL